MRSRSSSWSFWLLAPLVACSAIPASADVTVTARYTLVNGDTLTRASYYSGRRCRVTAPDGREFMYDKKGKQLTVINHQAKTFWSGPLARADSLADSIFQESRKEVAKITAQDQEKWMEKVQAFNDSIRVHKTGVSRKIAGYPVSEWILTAGEYLHHERWVARGMDVTNYGPEVEKVVMASVMDPLGRQLMRMLIGMRSLDGLVLSSTTTFKTLSQSGSFSYEAVEVLSKPIPESAWQIPTEYQRIRP